MALVCELVGGDLRPVAAHVRGERKKDLECRMADTICGRVIQEGRCCHPAGVSEQYPEDRLLTLAQAESFLGLPLLGSSGRKLGLLAIMHGSPLRDLEAVESVISVFAVRTAVELERRRAEEEQDRTIIELESANQEFQEAFANIDKPYAGWHRFALSVKKSVIESPFPRHFWPIRRCLANHHLSDMKMATPISGVAVLALQGLSE